MEVVCLDLEGVLVPEIWVGLAERTGIAELRATTRDIPDYDLLMTRRLEILRRHRLALPDIEAVVAGMEPLDGAAAFLDWLRGRCQMVVLSDTFYEFAMPLIRKLGYPTLFCNHLDIAEDGSVAGYRLRRPDQKRAAVRAFRDLAFATVAVGDSYNDLAMLKAADAGILFRPPPAIVTAHPQFPVAASYDALRAAITRATPARPPAAAAVSG